MNSPMRWATASPPMRTSGRWRGQSGSQVMWSTPAAEENTTFRFGRVFSQPGFGSQTTT